MVRKADVSVTIVMSKVCEVAVSTSARARHQETEVSPRVFRFLPPLLLLSSNITFPALCLRWDVAII